MPNCEPYNDNKRPPQPPEHCCYDEFRKDITETAEVFLPVVIDPSVTIGKIKIECCGDPIVICGKDECKHVCKLLITQKISVKIPLIYSVAVCVEDESIKCCTDPRCKER
jgi:hypothetical protein